MAIFTQCVFTDSAGTDLNAHTTAGCSPHSNCTWTRHNGATTAAAVFTAANRARASTSASTERYYASGGTPADADYSVYANIYVASSVTTAQAGVLGRLDTATATCYLGRYNGTQWETARINNGTFTSIATSAATLTAGNVYFLELRMVGTTISLYVNGVQILSNTDTGISPAGLAGITLRDNGTPSDTTAYHVDDFMADDTPGGQPYNPGAQDTPELRMAATRQMHQLLAQ